MSSMFTSLLPYLPFLKALQRQQGLSPDEDEDDSNTPADQDDGFSTAAWADPASAGGNGGSSTAAWADPSSARANSGASTAASADPSSAQGNGGAQNASGQPGQSTPGGAGTAKAQGRPPRLYAVVYTQGNRGEGGDQDFKNAAFTRADDIRNSPDFDPQKDNVWVYAVQTKDDFKNVVENLGNYEKPYGKVEQLALFSHGGKKNGPIFHKQDPQKGYVQDQFFDKPGQVNSGRDEFSHLKINFSPTATADLMMCHTAEPENGFAQAFADAQGVPTRGFGDTVLSSDPVKKVRGYEKGGREYLLGSGGNWFERNVLGYPPQAPSVFVPGGGGRPLGAAGKGLGGGGVNAF